ncbi:MAG TPA: peptidoglycan-binding domain-containing protein [Candidatus Dormibacteraeota bacterium]
MARRRLAALAVAPVLALAGVVVSPTVSVDAAFACHYSDQTGNQHLATEPGGNFELQGQEFASYYSGYTVVPSSTGVTSSGIEAQCLLQQAGFSPGTIDGIFGPNSQTATRGLQTFVNNNFHANILVDGLPGPQTWPFLRFLSQNTGSF